MSEERNRSGLKQKNLYEILGIEKSATDDEIKRAYRKLALKFHPDKNRDGDPAKTERFKEINHAHAILSNQQKRKIYDEYGEIGLKMADQFGEERITIILRPWVKWLCCTIAILTCGCFGCCCCFMCYCQCCCNFCCGKYKPEVDENFGVFATERTSGDVIIDMQPGVDINTQTTSSATVPTPNDCDARTSPTPNHAVPTNYGATET